MSSICSFEDNRVSLYLDETPTLGPQQTAENKQESKYATFHELSSKLQHFEVFSESKARLHEQFEKQLTAAEFFEKPDIVPCPWIEFKFEENEIRESPISFNSSIMPITHEPQERVEIQEISHSKQYEIVKNLEQEIDELKREIRKLKNENHENEKLKTKLSRIADLERENDELHILLKTQGEKLKESLGSEKDYAEMVKEIDREVNRIKNELEESEIQKMEIRRQFDLLSKTYQDMKNSYSNEIQVLNEKVIAQTNIYQDIDSKLRVSELKEVENQNLIDLANKRISELQEVIKDKDKQLQLQSNSINEYRSQLEGFESTSRYQSRLENCLHELEQKLAFSEEARFEQMKLYNELQKKITAQETDRVNPHKIRQLEDLFIKNGEKIDELSTKIYHTLDTALTARTESEPKFKKIKPKKKKSPYSEQFLNRLHVDRKNPCNICIKEHDHKSVRSPKSKINIIN